MTPRSPFIPRDEKTRRIKPFGTSKREEYLARYTSNYKKNGTSYYLLTFDRDAWTGPRTYGNIHWYKAKDLQLVTLNMNLNK